MERVVVAIGSSSKERSGAVEMVRTGRAGDASRLAGDGKAFEAAAVEPAAARFLRHSFNMAFRSFLTSELIVLLSPPPKLVRRLDLEESARAPGMGVPGPRERRARRDILNNNLID